MPDADLTEKIARVHRAHATWGTYLKDPHVYCLCGEALGGPLDHETHQAEAVAAVVQDEAAERWKERWKAAVDDAQAQRDEVERLRAEVDRLHSANGRADASDAEVERLRASTHPAGRHPGTFFLALEVTPHEWATRGQTWEVAHEMTAAELGSRLRAEADLWDPPRPRITTTWGEPDGIGGPRKGVD